MRFVSPFVIGGLMAATAASAPSSSWAASLNSNYYNVVTPIFLGTDGNASYVRLGNDGTATTTFNITVVGTPSGQVYGTTTVQVPSNGSIQVAAADLAKAANAGTLTQGDTGYALYMQDADSGLSYQHLTYNSTTGYLENVSVCHYASGKDYSALNSRLLNVHTSRLAGAPSQIYVHNYSTTAASYTVTVYDAATGTSIGTMPLSLQANATLSQPFSWYEQQLNWTPTSAQPHADMVFAPVSPATFQVELGNYVYNGAVNAYTDMTQRCGFTASSASQTAFAGTVAGPNESGTLAVSVQGTVPSASAPVSADRARSVKAAAVTMPASGTLSLTTGASVAATGSYDAGTGKITLTGGGYSFSGSVSGGIYSGTYTNANSVSGAFSSLTGSQNTVTAYCGTYSDPRPANQGGGTEGGIFNLQVAADGSLSGDTSSTYGPSYTYGTFSGHFDGTTFFVTHNSSDNDPNNTTNTTAQLGANGTVSGTFQGAGGTGQFSGSVCSVPPS